VQNETGKRRAKREEYSMKESERERERERSWENLYTVTSWTETFEKE